MKFKDLSKEAKAKAITSHRETAPLCDWCYDVFKMAETTANILGIKIDSRKDGKVLGIFFSGFYNQGDGAYFQGEYSYKKNAVDKIKTEFLHEKVLHKIAENLQSAQAKQSYQLQAEIAQNRLYTNSYSIEVSVFNAEDPYGDLVEGVEESITTALRQFNGWIFQKLQEEYEHLTSDEVVRTDIVANDYDFNEDGSMI